MYQTCRVFTEDSACTARKHRFQSEGNVSLKENNKNISIKANKKLGGN
jgi:hypothetical protein